MPQCTWPLSSEPSVREFAAARPAELRENGARLAPFHIVFENPWPVAPSLRFHLRRKSCSVIRILRWKWCASDWRSPGALACALFLSVIPGTPQSAFSLRPLPARRGILLEHFERSFFVNFSVKIRHQNQVSLIDVSGHLTFFEVGALGNSIQSLLKERRKNIVLNLSGLAYLDSSGIGELARIYVAVVKQGGAMKVIGLTPKVEEVLKITHLSQVFQEF